MGLAREQIPLNLLTALFTILVLVRQVACQGSSECSTSECPPIWKPVCAGDSMNSPRTFPNECFLRKYNNEHREKLDIIYHDECDNCYFSCPDDYSPVCAEGDSCSPITFSNLCHLKKYNCQYRRNLQVKHKGECKSCQCPDICPEVYEPVCAGGGSSPPKTFTNACYLKRHNCHNDDDLKIIHKGKCRDQDDGDCPRGCTSEYDPVCAGDERTPCRTFRNRCYLRAYNKHHEKDLRVLFEGECDDCPTSCTYEYNPVCARYDGEPPQTFPNPCVLQKYSCESNKDYKIINFGECERTRGDCPSYCTKEYSPVCAGGPTFPPKTFRNCCMVSLFSCITGHDLRILHHGHCNKQVSAYSYS